MRFAKTGLAAACFAAFILSGCSSLGLAPAKTLSDRIAYAYGTDTAVVNATYTQLKAGVISSTDSEAALKFADEAKATLDLAKLALTGGDLRTAEGRLAAAVNLLGQAQNYLNSKAVKP